MPNSGFVKRLNFISVVDLIRREGPISRAELARRLKLAPPTITRTVEQLKAERLLEEIGPADSSGVGRRANRLTFNYQINTIIGIDARRRNAIGVVADLAGNSLHQRQADLIRHTGETAQVEQLLEMIGGLLQDAAVSKIPVRGIGISVPGIVQDGMIVNAPSLGWQKFYLADEVQQRFGIPTFLENDANLAALGESWFGVGGGGDLVFISVSTGIGAGVIINGEIYRGADAAAGEVGYMLPGSEYLSAADQTFGQLESLVGAQGLEEKYRALARQMHGATLPLDDTFRARFIYAAAQADDPVAAQVVAEAKEILALLIVNIVALLNPGRVIVGGSLAWPWEAIIPDLCDMIRRHVPYSPEILASQLGEMAIVKGAIAAAIAATDERVAFLHRV